MKFAWIFLILFLVFASNIASAASPDLTITYITPITNYIMYEIKNQGDASAGTSTSHLYIDGVY